jgi:putative NADH-flavin reductase
LRSSGGKYRAMNIVCFGANGVTGRLMVKQALAEGHGVTAFTRHPEAFPIRNDQLRVAGGDVYDPSSVEKAVSSQDAVLSSLGVPFSRKPITVYSQGMANIVHAVQHHGVRRLVCVSATPVDPRYDTRAGSSLRRCSSRSSATRSAEPCTPT